MRGRPASDDAETEQVTAIDELLDRAVHAINRGDRATATALAGQVLAVDEANADAEDLLATSADAGEIRRLTIFFADLVDSTVLSTMVEPETYRLLVGRYREIVLRIVERYEGHLGSTKGDGLLAVFGHPVAHEDDVRRAVQAGLEITREVTRLGEQAQRRFEIGIAVRVGVHRGLVYLDTAQDEVYGLAANLAARVSGLAPPNTMVISDAVEPLVRNDFDVEECPAAPVKGIEGLITHYRVSGERAMPVANVGRGPLVGRERELAQLRESWTRAQTATLTAPGIAFCGEAGIGKSRLAAAAIEMAEDDGGVALELAGSPFHIDVGLHPVRTLLERRCGISRNTEPGERIRLLENEIRARSLDPTTMTPLLAPVLGIATEHGYEPVLAEGRRLQELITAAVQRYLLACFDGAAGLLIAEDLHWFDPSTLELLDALLTADKGQLLIIVTGRDIEWLAEGRPVELFELTPLTDAQTDELVLAVGSSLTSDQRAAVIRRCDGIPFYVQQVVAALAATPSADPTVPEALYEPLFARLRTSPNTVPVLEAAAVIGRNVDRGLLTAAAMLSEGEIDDVVGKLEDALVLEPWGTDGWRFRHELLREVAAELAPPSVRQYLHSRVADALVSGMAGGTTDWRMVASHYEQAERFSDAAAAYRYAAADARQRGALPEARDYLTHAIGHVSELPPGAERDQQELALRLERGLLATAAEGFSSPAAVADLGRCLQLGGTDLRDDQLFATFVVLMSYYVTRAELHRAIQAMELLRKGSEAGRQWFSPFNEDGMGLVDFLRGDFDAARPQLEAFVAGVEAAYDQIDAVWFNPNDALVMARAVFGLEQMVQGDLRGAKAELTRAADHAERLPAPKGPYSVAQARFSQVWVYTEAGELDRAEMLAADLLRLSEKHGFEAWRVLGTTQQACINGLRLIGTDDVNAAQLSARLVGLPELVDTWRSMALNIYLTAYDSILGRLHIAANQLGEARRRLDMGLALAKESEMHFYDAELLRLRAQTETNPDTRAATLAIALKLAHHQGALLFELRAALDAFELHGQVARSTLTDVVGRFPVDSGWSELARAKAILAQSDSESRDQ